MAEPELIPQVLDALDGLFGSRLGVQTILGPPVEWLQPELVAIGISTEDVAPVEQTSEWAGFGRKRAHHFDVTCLSRVMSGNTDMRAVTARAFDLLGMARAAVGEDRTLGGLVLHADIAAATYQPNRTEKGVVAVVEFRVRVAAHR